MAFFGGGGASAGIGGSTGATDNAILRADGTGAATLQNSDILIDDATTTTQNNVTIRNNHSQTNSSLVLSPKGTGSILAQKPDATSSGGNARGTNSTDFQTIRSSANQVASGQEAVIVGGAGNRANCTQGCVVGGNGNAITTGQRHFIGGGYGNQITSGFADSSICGGIFNTASSDQAAISGGRSNTVSAKNTSILGGEGATANRYGMQAHAAGSFASAGDAQRSRFVLRCKTTTNSAVEMGLDGGATYLTIPSGRVIFCNIKVVGVKSDGSAVATYERQYAAKNVGGTSSEVFAPVTIGTDNASNTTLAVATVDAGDYISIKPTGIASETWRWVASVDAVEVNYGT
jgi:hypothetical protein